MLKHPSSASTLKFMKMKKTNIAAKKTGFPFQLLVMLFLIFVKGLFFSKSWSETMLPSCSPPNDKTPFFIALLGKHIMFLELKNPSLFPALQLSAEWTRYTSQDAYLGKINKMIVLN